MQFLGYHSQDAAYGQSDSILIYCPVLPLHEVESALSFSQAPARRVLLSVQQPSVSLRAQ